MPSPINTRTSAPVRAVEAEVLAGGSISLLAQNEALTSNRSLLRAGSAEVPPHFHARSTELFYVLAGSLQALAGEEMFTLEVGDLLVVPPSMTHALAPAPDTDAEIFVVTFPPAERFDYYRLLDRVQRGEAHPKELKDSQERFDSYFVDSPAWTRARTEEAP